MFTVAPLRVGRRVLKVSLELRTRFHGHCQRTEVSYDPLNDPPVKIQQKELIYLMERFQFPVPDSGYSSKVYIPTLAEGGFYCTAIYLFD